MVPNIVCYGAADDAWTSSDRCQKTAADADDVDDDAGVVVDAVAVTLGHRSIWWQ